MVRAAVFVERMPRPGFAALFMAGGALAGITERVRGSAGLLDLDFWVDSRAQLERASVYCGPAKLVDVYAGSGGRLRVEATGLTRRRLSLPPERSSWIGEDRHAQVAADVLSLVDRVLPVLPESNALAGRALRSDHGSTVLARSFGPRFDDDRAGALRLADLTGRLADPLRRVPGVPQNVPPKASCDALVVDGTGAFSLVDAEAPRSAEIGFAPARAAYNLSLWDAWVAADPGATAHLRALARLREGLGLCPAGTAERMSDAATGTSSFVLVTEASVSAALVARLEQATEALVEAGLLDRSRFRYKLTGSDATRK